MLTLVLEISALVIFHVLSFLAACHALLTKRDPRAALGWAVTLIFLPVIGLIVYLIFGISRAHSRAERIMRELARIKSQYPGDSPQEDLPFEPLSEQAALEGIGRKLTSLHITPGNKITPLHNGDETYPKMLDAINAARDHVFLSTYIFNYGVAGAKFVDALSAAHARGVDTRVLVDGVGALYSWRKPWRMLKKRGVPTALFRPLRLFPPNLGINLRSHRKVMVCDGVGFTGGMNIADGNLLKLPGSNKIQDVHFQCEGPVVSQLRKAFLLNWSFSTGKLASLPVMEERHEGDSHCRVIVDGPGNDADLLDDLMCGGINLAHQEVRIMTPYFLPTQDLTSSLRSAALRGVDVRVVLPLVNNLPYISWAMCRIMPTLLSAGVRIWYQPPPFAHSKLLVIDKFYSLIGSANLDSRSLRLNFELDMEIYNRPLAIELSQFIDEKISVGEEIKLEVLKQKSLLVKLRNSAAWIFSPYF